MDLFTVLLILIIVCLLGIGVLIKMVSDLKNETSISKTKTTDNSPLQLQAYERLTLFAERAGLKNLVTRVEPQDQSVAALHSAMISELKSEYEYNVTQQMYVTPEVWNAVTRLRDQNIYVINQITASMPHTATSGDLKRSILEYALHDNAELNTTVLDAIQFEAKKLL